MLQCFGSALYRQVIFKEHIHRMENRNYRRELYLQPINYVLSANSTQETLRGSTINISHSGTCIFSFDRLVEGQNIIITKGLPVSTSFQTCTVRWAMEINGSLYKAGLMFNSVTSPET
jgi:hypothetical protein